METDALITAVLTSYDMVPPADLAYAARRAQVLQYIQEEFDRIYYYRSWPFRQAIGTVTVLSGATSAEVPVGFHEFGSNGGAFLGTRKMVEVNPVQLQQLLVSNTPFNPVGDIPFSLFGMGANGRKLFWTLPVTANTAFSVTYVTAAPTLTDGADGGLLAIPTQYHNSALLPAVVFRVKEAEGDSREWRARADRGLYEMVVNERPRKTAVQRMPRSVPGMW